MSKIKAAVIKELCLVWEQTTTAQHDNWHSRGRVLLFLEKAPLKT